MYIRYRSLLYSSRNDRVVDQYRYVIMSISYNTPVTVHICILIFNQKPLFRMNTYETREYSGKKTKKIVQFNVSYSLINSAYSQNLIGFFFFYKTLVFNGYLFVTATFDDPRVYVVGKFQSVFFYILPLGMNTVLIPSIGINNFTTLFTAIVVP